MIKMLWQAMELLFGILVKTHLLFSKGLHNQNSMESA